MSFRENPFKRIPIEHDGVFCWWVCDGCGADSHNRRDPAKNIQWEILWCDLVTIKEDWEKHIRESHGRTPDDFKDWH